MHADIPTRLEYPHHRWADLNYGAAIDSRDHVCDVRSLPLAAYLHDTGVLDNHGDVVRELVVPRLDAQQQARLYPYRLKDLGHHKCWLMTHTLQLLIAVVYSYPHSLDDRLAKFFVKNETWTVGGRDTDLPVLVGICGMPWDAPHSWWWRHRGVVPPYLVHVRPRKLRPE